MLHPDVCIALWSVNELYESAPFSGPLTSRQWRHLARPTNIGNGTGLLFMGYG